MLEYWLRACCLECLCGRVPRGAMLCPPMPQGGFALRILWAHGWGAQVVERFVGIALRRSRDLTPSELLSICRHCPPPPPLRGAR